MQIKRSEKGTHTYKHVALNVQSTGILQMKRLHFAGL